jgi:hypothetical protein
MNMSEVLDATPCPSYGMLRPLRLRSSWLLLRDTCVHCVEIKLLNGRLWGEQHMPSVCLLEPVFLLYFSLSLCFSSFPFTLASHHMFNPSPGLLPTFLTFSIQFHRNDDTRFKTEALARWPRDLLDDRDLAP